MRNRTILCAVACLFAFAVIIPKAIAQAGPFQNPGDLGHSTLAANDGWAATSPGTTGGNAALPANIKTVTTWAQLASALNNKSSVAKIIYVQGTIYGMVDANNNRLGCEAYYKNGYTLQGYLTAYDPATWGIKTPSGPMESARAASSSSLAPAVQLQVGSNTTIVGVGTDARIVNANLIVGSNVTNVIIRNITFQDAFDCFTVWSPTDINPTTPPYLAANNFLPGNWNANYDLISITGGKNVWIDHCAFTDEPDTEDALPFYFGRPWQVHDGEVDISNAADLVTLSWNVFKNHGKTSLDGSSDSATGDTGHIRVTFHHNYFLNLEERMPRDRYGRIDVYNNYYAIPNTSYVYSWGVGVNSAIYAENNAFITSGPQAGMTADRIVYPWKGTVICIAGTRFNNPDAVVDVLPLTNAAIALWSPPVAALSPNCGWTPTLRIAPADPAQDVPALVLSGAKAQPSVAASQDFGSANLGASNSATVTLTNSGSGILLMKNVSASGDFAITNNACSDSVTANSSCDLTLSFTPSAEGVRTGTLTISDWAQNSPQIVNLTGAGVVSGAVQLVATSTLANVGGNYQAVVTITNRGTGTAQNVQLTGATLGTANGATVPQSMGLIVHGGGSAMTTISFPSSAGASGTMVIERFTGTYTGGSFVGSIRAVLP